MIINIAGGTGQMGRTHTPIFEKAGHTVICSGRNTSPSLEEAASQSDVTIFAVPISATEEMIARIAPYCRRAVMDLTGLKTFPLAAMNKYAPEGCEVGGMHPLYRDFAPGRTVVSCPTNKSGEICSEVVRSLETGGATIKVMSPDKHDRAMALLQNVRIEMQEAYGLLLQGSGIGITDLYELAPPNTRPILDLIARQIAPANDELFQEMCEYNQFTAGSMADLMESLSKTAHTSGSPQHLRRFFGSQLRLAQERAVRIISAT